MDPSNHFQVILSQDSTAQRQKGPGNARLQILISVCILNHQYQQNTNKHIKSVIYTITGGFDHSHAPE